MKYPFHVDCRGFYSVLLSPRETLETVSGSLIEHVKHFVFVYLLVFVYGCTQPHEMSLCVLLPH